MAGYNRNSVKFIRVSCGQLKLKTGEDQYEYYDGWQGRIVSIDKHTGEYDGKPSYSIHVKMWDSETKEFVIVTFHEPGYYYSGFFGRIENVDFTKDVMLGVLKPNKGKDGKRKASANDNKLSFAYIKQPDADGEVISKVEDFDERFKPEISTGKRQGAVTDWDPVMDEVDKLLPKLNELIKKSLEKNPIKDMGNIPDTNENKKPVKTNRGTSKVTEEETDTDNISDDDLPF